MTKMDNHQATYYHRSLNVLFVLFLAGLGVSLDSEKPHLVGIDEDVLSTGITLYHLNDGYVIFTRKKILSVLVADYLFKF